MPNEIVQLRADLAEWKQAASVEAGLRREFLARAQAAEKMLRVILEANKDFRDGMPEKWDGDPLQDACDAAARLLDDVGNALHPSSPVDK